LTCFRTLSALISVSDAFAADADGEAPLSPFFAFFSALSLSLSESLRLDAAPLPDMANETQAKGSSARAVELR